MIFEISPNHYIIGTINFSGLINEIGIDSKKENPKFINSFKGNCTIEIYGNEGNNIPHFHIEAVNGNFSCCICLFDNRFFEHGKHKDKLDKQDWKILNDWMQKKNAKNPNKTNWTVAKDLWESINSDNYRYNTIPMNYYE